MLNPADTPATGVSIVTVSVQAFVVIVVPPVPAKFKGFSKLPEGVQQKMDPDLAQKYEKGGAVGSCRGMGAALRGGKFSGVR